MPITRIMTIAEKIQAKMAEEEAPAAEPDAKDAEAEEPAAEQRPQDADDDVADRAVAASLHDQAGEPARYQADQDEPDDFHVEARGAKGAGVSSESGPVFGGEHSGFRGSG